MSKKQLNSKAQKPNKNQIVDQQNEPFLRTIAKRVRNINKKLTQIQELKKREDIKPEQVEKINRKQEYEDEKSKLEKNADFFREVYAQNAELYRKRQLQELDNLANAIAVLRTNANFKESDKLNELNNIISEPSTASLKESVENISKVLKKYAGDQKLKKTLKEFIEESAESQEQTNVTVAETKPEIKETEPVKEQPKVQVQASEPVKGEPVESSTPVAVEEPASEVVQSQEPAVQVANTEQQAENSQAKEGEKKPRGEYKNRKPRNNRREEGERVEGERVEGEQPERRELNSERRGGRGARGNRRGGPRREGEEQRVFGVAVERKGGYNNPERAQNKPRYQPKRNSNEENDSDSSLDEPIVKNFRRDEIQKLENDGFTVVGKPKPKARDQKNYYDHTHGKKREQKNKQPVQKPIETDQTPKE